jgi:uncharacterized protein
MNPTSKVKAMPEDNKGKTYSYDVCGKCQKNCCTDAKPPLSENRKKIIQAYLKEQNTSIKEPFTTEDYSYPSVDEELKCVFNDKKTLRCIVHKVKPETCVAGPVTFDINFKTKKAEWFLKKNDLCSYAGDLYTNQKAAFQEHYEIARKQLMELIKALTAEELRAIVKIDEPETFKIGEENLPPEVIKKLGL